MDVVAALRAGLPVLLPTDTVYGLVSAPDETSAANLYELKGRAREQPTAILAATVDALLAAVPELPDATLRKLLPGPFTLVLPNAARSLPVADRRRRRRRSVCVCRSCRRRRARSSNSSASSSRRARTIRAARTRCRLDDVPRRIRDGCGAELDLGALPGTPSTVIDLSGDEPRILREGAVPGAETLRRLGP